jgi:hypothetical protein
MFLFLSPWDGESVRYSALFGCPRGKWAGGGGCFGIPLESTRHPTTRLFDTAHRFPRHGTSAHRHLEPRHSRFSTPDSSTRHLGPRHGISNRFLKSTASRCERAEGSGMWFLRQTNEVSLRQSHLGLLNLTNANC